ncbi:MAG: hypothetical protein GX817_06840 [Elusimicrobia bacterium]|nr:hypothetical protein [Elusimicrobiota bacterium]
MISKIKELFKDMFAKFAYISKGLFQLIRENKIYFMAAIFIVLAILAFLVFYIGPTIIISFIYAGV